MLQIYDIIKLLFSLGLAMLICGCGDGSAELNKEHIRKSRFVRVNNESIASRCFNIFINERSFYPSIDEIVKDGFRLQKKIDKTEMVDSLKAIWYNTSYRTVHNTPLTGLDWFHHPILFYNSAGLGLCDDVANVNEAIWAWMGFPARTWYMDAHVISEAYQGNKWKMYDSDLGIYFVNGDSILSFKDVEGNVKFILEGKNRREIFERTKNFDDVFWQYVASIYKNTESNQIEDWPPAADTLAYNYEIELPAGAEIIFGKALTQFPVEFAFDAPNYFNLLFKFSEIDYYKSELFLIPLSIKGFGCIRLNDEEYEIQAITDSVLFQREVPIKTLELFNAKDVEISYMVNGYVFNIFNDYYDFQIRGTVLDGLKVSVH